MFVLALPCSQDDKLKKLLEAEQQDDSIDWCSIAQHFDDRSDVQCESRWHKVLNPDLIKGPWTKEVCVCAINLQRSVVPNIVIQILVSPQGASLKKQDKRATSN